MWRHHNMCWKWPSFASRQDWTRRAIFWKVLATTSAVTAWISSVVSPIGIRQFSKFPYLGKWKSQRVHEEPPHSEKSGVWCGMSRRRIIGSIFFDATFTQAAYMDIFNTFVNHMDYEELSDGYFQQDGATSHTSHASMAEIQSSFGDRVISKGIWPPRSPDLTPPGYFLWGYLKRRVYHSKPRTIDALKANITEDIQAVTADVLARTFQNMARRFQSCLDANGGHFQHVLWCHISYTMRQVRLKFHYNILISGKIIKEMPGLVASGTLCISVLIPKPRS